jgi:hypothetical protein
VQCLCHNLQGVHSDLFESLRNIYKNFSTNALWIKETEKVTNHDVKAVEYFIKDAFEKLGLSDIKSLSTLVNFKILIILRFRFYKEAFESIHAFFDYFDIKLKI